MKLKKYLLLGLLVLMAFSLSGCIKPFDTPEFVTIEPSQTAFLIPLVGDTDSQGSFDSEELLAQAKVPTKEVQIPHRWVQTGRRSYTGEWRKAAALIIVERKPETREWTADTNTGTSSANQAITAESMGSISFMVSMNASAQIDEENATKFLYRYNNKPLREVMDTDIRALVESTFVEECASRTMAEILLEKKEIMDVVKKTVEAQFSEKGVTITTLGLKGDVVYMDPNIQKAINAEFTAQKEQEAATITNQTKIAKAQADAEAKSLAQETENAMNIAKATADAEAIRIRGSVIDKQIELIKLENQGKLIDKWNGAYPTVVGGDGMLNMLQLPAQGN